jgi:hypothetical protein
MRGMPQRRSPIAHAPTTRNTRTSKFLAPLLLKGPVGVRGVLNPTDILMHGQDGRIEGPSKTRVSLPSIEVNPHSAGCIRNVVGRDRTGFSTHLTIIDGPRNVGWRPLDSVSMISGADLAWHWGNLSVLYGRARPSVGLHATVGVEFLVINLVPRRRCGAFFVKEEGTDDTIAGRILNPRFETAVEIWC